MQLIIACTGKRLPGWAGQAVAEYQKRFPRHSRLVVRAVTQARRGKGADLARAVRDEGELLLAAAASAGRIIAVDPGGRALATSHIAARITDWRRDGGDAAFLIGGPDGLSRRCLERAGECWSLSALTLPHALARVVLAEQLYRACCIVEGLPYHR